jgi:PBSX family phage terminase large subunit
MAQKDLIPMNKRTKEEQKIIATKGGKASGEARRKKSTMLAVLEKTLDEIPKKNNEDKLTYQELATLGLVKGAASGNGKNYELIYNLMKEKQNKEESNNIIITLPARDIASSFVDINRLIDERAYREFYLEGGRGSTKSSFISEKIIELLENNPTMCCVVLRKVKDTLKDSVFTQLEWAIDTLSETYPGLKDRWKLTKSPLEITNSVTGQKIYFRGADDYGKIKSLKTPKGMYVGITWYEEFDQFAGMEEIRKINQSLIRGGEDFIQFYSYNTPASTLHYVNVEKIIPKESRLVHLSDYRSVPKNWLGTAFIDEANFLKETNEKLYENEYLGLMTGTGGNVFENVELREITDEEIATFDYLYQGLDFGWSPDPLAWTKMCYNQSQRVLYIFDEFVVNKMSNQDVWEHLKSEKGVKNEDVIIADSAEPKSIGDFRMYGSSMRGAEKGPESVRYSMRWLSALTKIVIDPNRCPISAREFSTYEYQKDKDDNYISAYVDKDNHCIDSVRYALNNIWKKRGN